MGKRWRSTERAAHCSGVSRRPRQRCRVWRAGISPEPWRGTARGLRLRGGGQAGKNAAENNSLSKDKKIQILDIRPGWLKPGVIDEDGELSLPGGGIAKDGKVSPTLQDNLISSANKPINGQGMSAAARAWEKHAGREGGTFEPLKEM